VYVPLVLIGMPLWIVFLSQTIVLLFQFPLHTERIDRLPRFIEYVFNTPSHHRVHHGANNPYLDKNYGGILIIWDRMFAATPRRPSGSATDSPRTSAAITVNFHEFGRMLRDIWRARTWRGRVGYVLRPSGWTEPGSHMDDRENAVREQVSSV
jgi:sterol desaturase/sphingolipid hydroxylase (fatty acid hydroxylase superfamily)